MLGCVVARLGIILPVSGFASCQIFGEQAVHHQVRITPDRRREMSVVTECQAVVADIVHIVARLRHSPQRKQLDGIEFRGILG